MRNLWHAYPPGPPGGAACFRDLPSLLKLSVPKDLLGRPCSLLEGYLDSQATQTERMRAVGEDLYLIYTPHGIDMTPYPAVLRHLEPFKRALAQRATRQAWYELQ